MSVTHSIARSIPSGNEDREFHHADVALTDLRRQALSLFDSVEAAIRLGRVREARNSLGEGLLHLRTQAEPTVWQQFARTGWQAHPLRDLLHQDPFTRRAYEKPRGYAGDAVLLDYLYEVKPIRAAETSPLAETIFDFFRGSPSYRAVNERMELLARTIDETAANTERPRIMSLACGHLREGQRSAAVREGRVGAFYAVDQDPESLAVVRAEQGHLNVVAMHGTVRSVLSGETSFADLDLAYAAGLYDYLAAPVAARLTNRLFSMVKPGGRVLVANFTRQDAAMAAYMETFMGWELLYRTEHQVRAFAAEIPPEKLQAQRLFSDPSGTILYLELQKR
jgi:SAM-dependent methyltransferase